MIKYGLISETDARTIEKTIDLICDNVKDGGIMITEIGVYSGETGNGIKEYVKSKNRGIFLTGIENKKDGEVVRFAVYDKFIIGDSSEVYNSLKGESQDLIFFDGCHCFAHVVSDIFCYAPKVKVGGYMAFHDTGRHIQLFKDFQHGDKTNPGAYISVREAINRTLRCSGKWEMFLDGIVVYGNWDLIFDEADETNEAGGVMVFQKNI